MHTPKLALNKSLYMSCNEQAINKLTKRIKDCLHQKNFFYYDVALKVQLIIFFSNGSQNLTTSLVQNYVALYFESQNLTRNKKLQQTLIIGISLT